LHKLPILTPSYSADALEAGCNIAITKPINIEELMGIIKELLD